MNEVKKTGFPFIRVSHPTSPRFPYFSDKDTVEEMEQKLGFPPGTIRTPTGRKKRKDATLKSIRKGK